MVWRFSGGDLVDIINDDRVRTIAWGDGDQPGFIGVKRLLARKSHLGAE